MTLFHFGDAVFGQEGAEVLGGRLHVALEDLGSLAGTIFILSCIILLHILPQATGSLVLISCL